MSDPDAPSSSDEEEEDSNSSDGDDAPLVFRMDKRKWEAALVIAPADSKRQRSKEEMAAAISVARPR